MAGALIHGVDAPCPRSAPAYLTGFGCPLDSHLYPRCSLEVLEQPPEGNTDEDICDDGEACSILTMQHTRQRVTEISHSARVRQAL
jgi:hypothetical protein